LGLGDKSKRFSPTLLKLPKDNEQIVSITCGGFHVFCSTRSGDWYAWGGNKLGQLGQGHGFGMVTPILFTLPKNETIFFLTCGLSHNICLTAEKTCYVWGYNHNAQLGINGRGNVFFPLELTLPNDEKIAFASCGTHHTICLSESNLCYVWGYNKYGQLSSEKYEVYTPTLSTLWNNLLNE